MIRKQITAVLCAAVFLMGILSACGSRSDLESVSERGGLQIVTTIFPLYDWVREILGDNPAGIGLTMLMDQGVDLHSFQPSAADIVQVSTCDMFVYIGGESDRWIQDALVESANKDMKQLSMMRLLETDLKEEEIIEGMQSEEDPEETEYDEHIWLSLKMASALCGILTESVQALDPDHAEVYDANASAYRQKLAALDETIQNTVNESDEKTLLFGDRFPFRYFTEDYGIQYYAAFAGCEAETEASFETISFLAGKMNELDLPCVITIDGSDQKIAETIIQNTEKRDQKILTMNSMQAVGKKEMEQGVTYLSIMEKNKTVLQEALQ